jgi:hypothetical protein
LTRPLAALLLVAMVVAAAGANGRAPDAVAVDLAGAEPVRCGGIAVDILGTADGDRLRGDGRRNGIVGLGGQGERRAEGRLGGRRADRGPGKDTCLGGSGPGNDGLRSC